MTNCSLQTWCKYTIGQLVGGLPHAERLRSVRVQPNVFSGNQFVYFLRVIQVM